MLNDEERAGLTRLVRSKLTSVRMLQRGRIELPAAEGMQGKDIAEQLGPSAGLALARALRAVAA